MVDLKVSSNKYRFHCVLTATGENTADNRKAIALLNTKHVSINGSMIKAIKTYTNPNTMLGEMLTDVCKLNNA